MTHIFNSTILMSDANNFNTEQPINPYYNLDAVDLEKAKNEHAKIKELLTEAGINIITVPSPVDSQDGVYAANWGLVRGDKAGLARLPSARKTEEAYAEKILTSLGKKVIHIPDNLKFSGQGDALACGNFLFCGNGYRSDAEAQKFVANTLGYERIQLRTIPQLDDSGNQIINHSTGWPDSFFYDIDLALAIIKAPTDSQKGLIAYCPEAFTPESRELLANFNDVDKIEVSITEAKQAFATNLVSTGETVIMSALAPELAKNLENCGLKILSPEITELAKGGGYIRCVTLTID
jgi:N-dimethylarginine dimethylaminohydrolase